MPTVNVGPSYAKDIFAPPQPGENWSTWDGRTRATMKKCQHQWRSRRWRESPLRLCEPQEQ